MNALHWNGIRRLVMTLALLGFVWPTHHARAQTMQAERISLTGRIAELFANRFILATERERLLVEPADPLLRVDATTGDTVKVEGERFGPVIKAARIERVERSTSAPDGAAVSRGPEDIPSVLRRLGLTAIDAPVTKKHHTEVLARLADGRNVYVSFDRAGRLWEIEDAVHDRDAAVPRNLTRSDYDRLAREAGFTATGGFEERRRHVEVEALNKAGERLVLHIDRAGVIYKQVWPR